MEFSCLYHIRQGKLAACEVPTFSEINSNLGTELSTLFCESCPDSLKEDLGLTPILCGPGYDLWNSPSDVLMGRVALKPPATTTHMKALTHEGIIEIGHAVERHVIHEMEKQKQESILEQERILLFITGKLRDKTVKEALERHEQMFQFKLMKLNEHFKRILQQELTNLEKHTKAVYEQILEERTENMTKMQDERFKERIEEAAKETVEKLTNEYLQDIAKQEAELRSMYEMKLEGQAGKYGQILDNQQEVFGKVLKQLNHNLQCNNVANLMYLLCTERRKCMIEQQKLVDQFSQKVYNLETSTKEQKERIEKLIIEKERISIRCGIREECLRRIISQFQKFINYALCAKPGQAEFLLNVQKMMTFELTEALLDANTAHHHHRTPLIMLWKRPSQKGLENQNSDTSAKDYHECMNEFRMPNERESDYSLYAMDYKAHTYIREDFRDKILCGIPLRATSMIWNKDVEHLVHLLKESVQGVQEESGSPNISGSSIRRQRSHISRRSSVHFTQESMHASIDRQNMSTMGILATHDSLIMQKSVRSRVSAQDEEVVEKQCADGAGVALLATYDSLTIIRHTEHTSKTRSIMDPAMRVISNETLQLSKCKHYDEEHQRHAKSVSEAAFRTISTDTLKLTALPKKSPASKPTSASEVGSMREKRMKENEKCKKDPVLKNASPKNLLSKLSMHRDSVDLIRSSLTNNPKMKQILLGPTDDEDQLVINVPQDNRISDVNFSKVIKVLKDIQKPLYKPWNKNDEKLKHLQDDGRRDSKRDDFLNKANQAKVIGDQDQKSDEYFKRRTCTEFTVDRMHSLLGILKKDNSLMRIFTSCNQ